MPHSPSSDLTLFILLWLQMLILEPTRCISTSGPLLPLCPSLISQNFTPLSVRPSFLPRLTEQQLPREFRLLLLGFAPGSLWHQLTHSMCFIRSVSPVSTAAPSTY